MDLCTGIFAPNPDLTPGGHLMRPILMAAVLLSLLCGLSQAAQVTGTVYYDRNANGQRETDEPGLPGVRISDGITVTCTRDDGSYTLNPPDEYTVIRVSWHAGYWPTANRFWEGVEGATPRTGLDFALRSPVGDELKPGALIVQITDVHTLPDTVHLIKQVAEQIAGLNPRFVIATGDLVMDVNGATTEARVRELYSAFQAGISPLPVPVLSLPGNHEMCGTGAKSFEGDQSLLGEGAYSRLRGPLYYSFDNAGMHFVLLHATRVNTPGKVGGGYRDGLTDVELEWLKQDLFHVPPDTPICVFMHEPPRGFANRDAFAALLQNRPVIGMFAGHTHEVKTYDFAGARVWESGAVSGSWWAGPERKNPCPDGSAPGYRLIWVTPEGSIETIYRGEWAESAAEFQSVQWDPATRRIEANIAAFDPAREITGFDLHFAGMTFSAPAEVRGGGAWREAEIEGFVENGNVGGFYGLRAKAVTADSQGPSVTLNNPMYVPLPAAELDGSQDGKLRFFIVNQHAANLVTIGGQSFRMPVDEGIVDRWIEMPIPAEALKGPAQVTITAQGTPPDNPNLDDFRICAMSLTVGNRQLVANETVQREQWLGDNDEGRPAEFTFNLAEVNTAADAAEGTLSVTLGASAAPTWVMMNGVKLGDVAASDKRRTATLTVPADALKGPLAVTVGAGKVAENDLADFSVATLSLKIGDRQFLSAEKDIALGDGKPAAAPECTFHLLPFVPEG